MAVGDEYRALAEMLLDDIAQCCAGTPTYVVSDESSFGMGWQAVRALPFVHPGFWYMYYGKLQAIRAALLHHDICIFLDADCRLKCRPPMDVLCNLPPGAYGAYVQSFPFKFTGDQAMFVARGGKERWLRNSPERQQRLYTALGRTLGIPFEDCCFLHEACLVFVKSDALMCALSVWEFLGRAASARLLEWGEGCTLGMALRKFHLRAGEVPDVRRWLFKDLLVATDERTHPAIEELLVQRTARASEGARPRQQKVRRFASGLVRYLKCAPTWLLGGERIALARLNKEVP